MLSKIEIEALCLADVHTRGDQRYTYTITSESLGIYTITRLSDNQTWTWRCRGDQHIEDQIGKALHAERFPPDDGSLEWLENVAQDACKMFYIIEADEREAKEREAQEAAQTLTIQRYLLNSTGTTYHSLDCAKASTGSLKTLEDIASSRPDAKPCAICNPPSLAEAAVNE